MMHRRQGFGRAATALAMALSVLLALGGCGSAPVDETTGWSAEKLYAEAKEDAAGGSYERAISLLEKLEGRAAGTLLAQQAQLDRAWMLYRSNEKAQALVVIERFMRLNPSNPALDYALYLQGLINFNDNLGVLGSLSRQDLSERDQQASRDSFQSFKQLVDQYPNSVYAADAQVRMNYIINSLAAYEVHVARYYFRRGAYVAAVNRAQRTVQDYQQSPSAEEALRIMVQSYDRLGLTQLRDDAERVLQRSFPQGGSSGGGNGTAPRRAWWQFW